MEKTGNTRWVWGSNEENTLLVQVEALPVQEEEHLLVQDQERLLVQEEDFLAQEEHAFLYQTGIKRQLGVSNKTKTES